MGPAAAGKDKTAGQGPYESTAVAPPAGSLAAVRHTTGTQPGRCKHRRRVIPLRCCTTDVVSDERPKLLKSA